MAAAKGVGQGTELEQIQRRSRDVANKTLEVTNHLLALTEEVKLLLCAYEGKVVNNQPQRVMTDERNGCEPMTGYIGRITNDAIEDQMENNMALVSSNIGNLRNMALDFSSEITHQTRQLEIIKDKAEYNADEVEDANDRAYKLTKS